MADFYKTLKGRSQGLYKEKMSKFISFAEPVQNADEAKAVVKRIQNEYHDARHVCWAYMLGAERETFRANDNGEPSGTAGKPILGQINSKGLTDIIILVVRYFGGVKLGTSGLTSAYRAAAAEAISAAEIISKTVDAECHFSFEYPMLSGVMKVVRDMDARILKQDFGMQCNLTLSIRRGKKEELTEKINKALSPF